MRSFSVFIFSIRPFICIFLTIFVSFQCIKNVLHNIKFQVQILFLGASEWLLPLLPNIWFLLKKNSINLINFFFVQQLLFVSTWRYWSVCWLGRPANQIKSFFLLFNFRIKWTFLLSVLYNYVIYFRVGDGSKGHEFQSRSLKENTKIKETPLIFDKIVILEYNDWQNCFSSLRNNCS